MAPNTQPSDETYPGSRKRAHSIGAGSMRKAMEDSDLWHAISDERFWRMPEDEVLILIRDEFSNELDRLKNAYSLKATGVPRPRSPSISERLYHGKNYDEINRTLLGVLVLRWIVTNDYDSFTRNQKPELALKRDSFDWLHTFFWSKLNTPDDAYALVLSMIINDLGKDPNLAADYAELKGEDITNVNHDMILLCAVEAGMVKALDRLTDQHREFLMDGIRLGSELNFGQLAQAENAPASLAGLEDMRGKDRAFQMRFMEQVLDVSGAKGHEDWTAALVMIEPVFQSYHNVYDVASGIISGSYTLRQGFDLILTRKLELLQKAGFDHSFDINKPTDRAMLRIFCLGNTNSPENAEIFYRAFFDSIPDIEREDLVHGLNVDGSEAEPAIQPTYTPAMLAKAMANTKKGTPEEKVRAIAAMLRYLVRVFKRARTITQGVTVVEREVRLVDAVVSSAEFKERPEIVTQQPVPEDQVANRVRV
ncbi:uncharacterized protein HMPREF1541_09151 [Cyphellophora europaea CBS 101466]|uniref:Uncharacterized protein n=1 Tax=Cyphellophora europaea (strain CBS 101466) TaxID=1220924 RepID=W2S9K1_CYPE1|nr:uncharacterized protein HMPREF1541_09151 [Cyphellophora europaea CBS 101466]ETN45320.1 hypothetical protein HMPREF1541_09151 [Cyphellophora europaea CBS 101466]